MGHLGGAEGIKIRPKNCLLGEDNCVYMYGNSISTASSKRLRGLEVDAGIFECSNKLTREDKLKCAEKVCGFWLQHRG